MSDLQSSVQRTMDIEAWSQDVGDYFIAQAPTIDDPRFGEKIGNYWHCLIAIGDQVQWTKAYVCWLVHQKALKSDGTRDTMVVKEFLNFTGLSEAVFSRGWRVWQKFIGRDDEERLMLATSVPAGDADLTAKLEMHEIEDRRFPLLSYHLHTCVLAEGVDDEKAEEILTVASNEIESGKPTMAVAQDVQGAVNEIRGSARTSPDWQRFVVLAKHIGACEECLEEFCKLFVESLWENTNEEYLLDALRKVGLIDG